MLVCAGFGQALASEANPELAMVRLRTNDGRGFVGQLVRDVPSHVLLKIGGVEARFERAQVAHLAQMPVVADELAQRRAALAQGDIAGRIALAQEMFEADLLDAARWELLTLRGVVPEDGPASVKVEALWSAVEARQALEVPAAPAASSESAADQTPRVQAEGDAATPKSKGSRRRPDYLSDDVINLVRVYEIDLNAEEIERVSVPEVVLREAIAAHRTHPAVPPTESQREAIIDGSSRDQLAFVFALEARSLYGKVRVPHDPEALAAFRREINPGHVARYFELQFGGGRVPGLELVRFRPKTTAEAYTNFVSLCRFRHEGRAMIDRFNPESSLLLQWALPREEALHPAPDLPNWRPRFRSIRDPRYVRLLEWIDSLVKFDPDYATLLPTTQPGTDAPAGAGDTLEPRPQPAVADEAPETGG